MVNPEFEARPPLPEQHVTTMTEMGRQAMPSDQDASGRTLGESEIAAVRDALESGVLTSTRGPWVAALEQRFAEILGVRHVVATSSGTAAVHAAIAAIDPEPGDEVDHDPDHRHGGDRADHLPERGPGIRGCRRPDG